jgi:hypothetical protein
VFLNNHQIQDTVRFSQEVMHPVKTQKLPAIVLKIDLAKAYDRVNWWFLILLLLELGVNF